MQPKKNKGFTLIELLVVIAIIGILAGMVLVSMTGARAKARDAKRQNDMRAIVSAEEMYNGSEGAGSYLSQTTTTMPTAIGTYLPAVPVDPTNVSPNVYATFANSTDTQHFCFYAKLEQAIGTKWYVVASDVGTFLKTGAPGTIAACDVQD